VRGCAFGVIRWGLPCAVLGCYDDDNDVFGLSAPSGVAALRVGFSRTSRLETRLPCGSKRMIELGGVEPVFRWLE
jgi:hypothetical protein